MNSCRWFAGTLVRVYAFREELPAFFFFSLRYGNPKPRAIPKTTPSGTQVLRASSPLFRHPKAFRELPIPCPLARRFPTTHTGMLVHYEDVHVALAEIIDDGSAMNRHKMWRLLVWIFLGNLGFDWRPSIFAFSMGFDRNVLCFLLLENWRHWLLEPEMNISESYIPSTSSFLGVCILRLFVVRFFSGNGGQGHVAWHELKNSWSTSTWRDDKSQPLSILRFVSAEPRRSWENMEFLPLDGGGIMEGVSCQCFFETLITGLAPCWENFGWEFNHAWDQRI